MKLHLPQSLRRALLVSPSILCCALPSMQAAEIKLTNNPTIWQEGNAPGYTGTAGDYYTLSTGKWNIKSGEYAITLDSSSIELPAFDVYALNLSSGTELSIEQGASLSCNIDARNYDTCSVALSGTIVNAGKMDILNECNNKQIVYNAFNAYLVPSGLEMKSSAVLSNVSGGKISITANTTAIYASASTLMNESGAVIDISLISENPFATGYNLYTGISLLNSITTNEAGATINVTLTGDSDDAVRASVLGVNGGSMTNAGNIVIADESKGCIWGDVISIGGSAVFYNSGSIELVNVDSGDLHESDIGIGESAFLYLLNGSELKDTGEDVEIVSSGTVCLGGVLGEENVVSESESGCAVSALTSGLSFSGGKLNLLDNVTLNMGGDLTVVADVAMVWNEHSLTVNNGDSVYTVAVGDKFSAAWNTAFSLTPDGSEGDILLTQDGTGKDVTLRDGAVKLKDGSLKATGTLSVGGGNKATSISSATPSLVLEGAKGGSIQSTSLSAENITIYGGAENRISLTDCSVTVQGGALNLQHAIVRGTTSIAPRESATPYTASFDNVTFVLNNSNSSGSAQAPAGGGVLTSTTASSPYYISYDMLSGATVSGSMTFDVSLWANDIQNGQYDGIILTLGQNAQVDMGQSIINARLDEQNSYTATSGENNSILFAFTETDPDPTPDPKPDPEPEPEPEPLPEPEPVNPHAALAADGNAVANTLWSSTSAVRSFARAATTQLGIPADELHGVTLWGSGLGDFVSMDGFTSNAGGYAVGVDKQFRYDFRMGIAFGQMFGSFSDENNRAEVKQQSIMGGLYMEHVRALGEYDDLRFTAYAAYGAVSNEADTMVGGSAELPGSASWNDNVLVAGGRAEWVWQLTEDTQIAPFIGVEYVYGGQEDFTEEFADGSREYYDGSMQALSLPVGITLCTQLVTGEVSKLLPQLTVAYVGDVIRKNPHVHSRVFGVDSCHEGTAPGRSAFQLNAGAYLILNERWSMGAFYNLEARSKNISQEALFTIRRSF